MTTVQTAQRYWDDLAEGDELPGFALELTETKVAEQVSGSQDFYPVHHDRAFAAEAGHADIFFNTGFTRAALCRLLTDLAGDDGWVRRLQYQMRRMNLPGDTLQVRGRVTGKAVADDGAHVVELEIWIENDREGVTTPGTATVELPCPLSPHRSDVGGEAPAEVPVLVMAPVLGPDLAFLAVDPRVVVLDGAAAYAAELHDEDPDGPAPPRSVPPEERDRLLARAEVLVVGHPVPRRLVARAPRLRWAHHTQAGVSNLHRSDLWTSDVTLTSGRGTVSARAIAEWAVAAVLLSARGLDEAARQKHDGRFTRRGYRMRTVAGSTLGVVGLGGIGREVGRMGQALGMRVVATRWSIDAPEERVDGADLVLPADRLLEVAAQSDFLVVCSQLTEATWGLIDRAVLAAMPAHAVLVNVARGEEVDEDALVEAIEAGRIAGAVLDVQVGELEGRPPRRELVEHPHVLLTPHLSGMGQRSNAEIGRQLVVDNLRRHLAGEPLRNVVDRQRGY